LVKYRNYGSGSTRGISKTAILVFLSLATAFVSVAFLLPDPVLADVPDVLNVEPWTNGTETVLNITVRHSAPTSSHYINIVQVDVDGAVDDINLVSQSTNPFVIQYNMGEVAGEPSVRARAHCTLHGWGSWSES
jgi:desulfoferrodoxin (superoxide reductase-like protein)